MSGIADAEHPGVKKNVATRLRPSAAIDEQTYRRLRALSISTVEELLGLIVADPAAVHAFVPQLDLPQIQADAPAEARGSVLHEMERLEGAQFALGAWAPEDLTPGSQASAEYVESWLAEAEATTAVEDEGDEEPTVNLLGCFGPVRDQAKRGTCVAQTVVAVLECQRRRLAGETDALSAQFVYWWAKSNDGSPNIAGTWQRIAMPGAESDGACRESTWPYNPTKIANDEAQGPPPPGATDEAGRCTLRGPRELGRRDVDAIRACLDDGRPVGISVPVYNNWYSNRAAHALGLIPMPLPNSALEGGHAMCVMGYGYDSDFAGGGYFIVRNSWGEEWAPRSPVAPGYGAIPFLYVAKYGWEAWTAD